MKNTFTSAIRLSLLYHCDSNMGKYMKLSGLLSVLAVFVLLGLCSFNAIHAEELSSEARTNKAMCTAIGAGRKATADGSTVTTHNADCAECDFRITHVPARDWPAGSKRPVYLARNAYPRYVQDGKIDPNNLGPDYLVSKTYPDRAIYDWNATRPMIFIDQVSHTYAYTMGSYGIQNEKQLSIGESTCGAAFAAQPISRGGQAAMEMQTLTQIAMERCETARCAIKLMGDLSTAYGFYGEDGTPDTAGEALVISDTVDTWMFHVLPDDTGSSAIWIAQRVPEDHITAVANQFVIGAIDLSDKANFLGSANVLTIAAANGLWDPDTEPFHFAKIYGQDIGRQSMMCTRRVWRVFTLAAPSLLNKFSPFTDSFGSFGFGENGDEPYPFSIKPDVPLKIKNFMEMNRDQYEGTLFDMTAGMDAGPFGDPIRYRALTNQVDPDNGITDNDFQNSLFFERPIALWRTSYSTVTQSRAWLPNVIGAVTWIAQYNPRHSTFIPVYASSKYAPTSMNTGTLYKFDKSANFWIHSLCSNYLSKWYRYSITDIVRHEDDLETQVFSSHDSIEQQALALLQRRTPVIGAVESDDADNKLVPGLPPGADPLGPHPGDVVVPEVTRIVFINMNGKQVNVTAPTNQAVQMLLTIYSNDTASFVRDRWWDFFFKMISMYRDIYRIVDEHAESFDDAIQYTGAPRRWLEQIGYFGPPGTPAPSEGVPVPLRPIAFPSLESAEEYKANYPDGENGTYPWFAPSFTIDLEADNDYLMDQVRSLTIRVGLAGFLGTLFGMLVMYCAMRSSKRDDYIEIMDK